MGISGSVDLKMWSDLDLVGDDFRDWISESRG